MLRKSAKITIILTHDRAERGIYLPAWFSFEAGGRAFRPVVSHSMSGALVPMFEEFVLFITIAYKRVLSLSHS